MLQYCDLDLKTQLLTLAHVTQKVHLNEFQRVGAILPNAYYDQRKAETSLSEIVNQYHSSDKLIQSVLATLQQPSFATQFELYSSWGFVLQLDGKNIFVCTNLQGYESKQVICICLDSLINSARIDYLYGTTIPDRWKMLYAGFGFAIVAYLQNAANTFRIHIE